eukprot:1582542-Rhodomonas_salina.1
MSGTHINRLGTQEEGGSLGGEGGLDSVDFRRGCHLQAHGTDGICLRPGYAMPSTDLLYGPTSGHAVKPTLRGSVRLIASGQLPPYAEPTACL